MRTICKFRKNRPRQTAAACRILRKKGEEGLLSFEKGAARLVEIPLFRPENRKRK